METKFRGRNGGNQAGRPGTRTARGSTQYGDRIDAPTEGQVSVATADGNAERAPVGHATGHPRDGRFRESAMSIETRRETRSETEADEDAEVADRNAVAVHFADGTVASYAVVVRAHDEDWLYAERLVGEGDGLDEEEVESINPAAVHRIRSDCVHRFDGGVVHHGSGLLVDPDALLADGWLGGR